MGLNEVKVGNGTEGCASAPPSGNPGRYREVWVTAGIRILFWLALLLALYRLFLALGNLGPAIANPWITSDSLYPVHVFIDTVLEGNSFSGWQFSVAPCWFPDLFLTGVFMGVFRNPISATLLAGFVQIGILVAGLFWLWKAAGVRVGVLSEVGALAAAVTIALKVGSHPTENPYGLTQFFLPQTHLGALLVAVICLALAIYVVRAPALSTKRRYALLAGYSVLSLLGGMSDLMFIVQMIAPLSGMLILALLLRLVPRKPVALVLACGWIASLAGYAVNSMLLNTTPVTAQADEDIGLALSIFAEGFLDHLKRGDSYHVLSVGWLVMATTVAVWILQREYKRGAPQTRSPETLLAIVLGTLVLAAVGSAAAIILGGSTTLTVMNNYSATLRYIHPGFLLPAVILPFFCAWVFERWLKKQWHRSATAAGLSAIVVSVATIALYQTPKPATPASQYVPPLVGFIDDLARKERLEFGVAGYWQARPITLLGRSGVRAYAVTPWMEPFLWVSNAEWYKWLYAEAHPKVDFVVLDDPAFKLDAPAAYKKFGVPARTAEFQGVRVLLYRCHTCSTDPELNTSIWRDQPLVRFNQNLTSTRNEIILSPGQKTTIPVEVGNPGADVWASAGNRPVNIGYRIFRNGVLLQEGERTALPSPVAGRQSATVAMRVQAPSEPGEYTLRVSLIQEGVAWFMDFGGKYLPLRLLVR